MIDVQPVFLEGEWVRLEPASPSHAAQLSQIANEETFRFFVTAIPFSFDKPGFRRLIDSFSNRTDMLAFTVIDQETNDPIGMTTYLDIRAQHDGLEIGWTWYAEEHRGTRVNPECKILLLSHAFETLKCVRVQLKCDERNMHSQRAIEKLGAKREGVLRRHGILADGYVRNTVMYSIIDSEWPTVRAGLEARLKR